MPEESQMGDFTNRSTFLINGRRKINFARASMQGLGTPEKLKKRREEEETPDFS